MGRAVVRGCVMLCEFVRPATLQDNSVGLEMRITPDWGLAGFSTRGS
jgi:hypothetical protein